MFRNWMGYTTRAFLMPFIPPESVNAETRFQWNEAYQRGSSAPGLIKAPSRNRGHPKLLQLIWHFIHVSSPGSLTWRLTSRWMMARRHRQPQKQPVLGTCIWYSTLKPVRDIWPRPNVAVRRATRTAATSKWDQQPWEQLAHPLPCCHFHTIATVVAALVAVKDHPDFTAYILWMAEDKFSGLSLSFQ